ncbi:hypothetical protein [Tahibacter amnicola]|uniref:Hpt domain-containing protein n=1 Tax=Tahibacter amnicola TaxID=2976241 RepID=A0ABY6BEA0_9GAMM|nr:hypothetical protein [Tahibacter amnicola]UXI68359.1 hypothetical protein N4264_01525 [Tahibacter amnicola]
MREITTPAAVRQFLQVVHASLGQGVDSLRAALDAGDGFGTIDAVHALKNEFVSIDFAAGVSACEQFSEVQRRGGDLAAAFAVLAAEAAAAQAAILTEPEYLPATEPS